MPSSPLGSTNFQTTSDVACHHSLWAAHTVERRQAWHDINALGQHTRSERRRAWHAIIAFGQHTQSNDVRRGKPSWTMDNTPGRTTSGVAFHYSPWTANRVKRHQAWHAIIAFKLADIVRRRRAWHAIIALGRQTPSNDVGGGMPSPPLDST